MAVWKNVVDAQIVDMSPVLLYTKLGMEVVQWMIRRGNLRFPISYELGARVNDGSQSGHHREGTISPY
jgi:hypothetical protein